MVSFRSFSIEANWKTRSICLILFFLSFLFFNDYALRTRDINLSIRDGWMLWKLVEWRLANIGILVNGVFCCCCCCRTRWIFRHRPPMCCWRTDGRRGCSYRAIPALLLRPAWEHYGRNKAPTTTSRLFTRRSWRTLLAISSPSITATSATKAKVIFAAEMGWFLPLHPIICMFWTCTSGGVYVAMVSLNRRWSQKSPDGAVLWKRVV